MKALQYIYTSWRNGNSAEKGYMIYSRSEGISDAECAAIKDVMQYRPPRELPLTPSPQEIAELFPFTFSSFTLPGGRGCIAQSTYLGKDYTGRFGNYIIYALVFDKGDLPCRSSFFFGEPYIKTFMTDEELNADSPVPPLPALDIATYGSVINDEELSDFLVGKEEDFAQLIAGVLSAKDRAIPFYLYDTREHLIQWMAAVQRILPINLAHEFAYNTYVNDPEKLCDSIIRNKGIDFHMIGIRPDTDDFRYESVSGNGKAVVVDFINGYRSEDIIPGNFAKAMAASMTWDRKEIDEFGRFIENTDYTEINSVLDDGYMYFRLLRYEEFTFSQEELLTIIHFGMEYCSDEDNSSAGLSLMMMAKKECWPMDFTVFSEFWLFACKYSGYMIDLLFDLFLKSLHQKIENGTESYENISCELENLKQKTPEEYGSFLTYLNSENGSDLLISMLSGNCDMQINCFYFTWLSDNYHFGAGIMNSQPISEVMQIVLKNISECSDSEQMMARILIKASDFPALFEDTLNIFMNYQKQNPEQTERMFNLFAGEMENETERAAKCEDLLFQIPAAVPFAILICVNRIRTAKKPEEQFWDFYQRNQIMINQEKSFSLEPLITACLDSLDSISKEKQAVKMLEKLQENVFENEAITVSITDIIENCTMKTLFKIDRMILQKAYLYRERIESGGTNKIKAVIIGLALAEQRGAVSPAINLSTDVVQMQFQLSFLNRKDYEYYIKMTVEDFLSIIISMQDTVILFQLFYHAQYYNYFLEEYFSAIKKMRSKGRENWVRIAAWTCLGVLKTSLSARGADEMYDPTLKFLKTCNEDELKKMKSLILEEDKNVPCDDLFQKAAQKDSFTKKLGSFFRKK